MASMRLRTAAISVAVAAMVSPAVAAAAAPPLTLGHGQAAATVNYRYLPSAPDMAQQIAVRGSLRLRGGDACGRLVASKQDSPRGRTYLVTVTTLCRPGGTDVRATLTTPAMVVPYFTPALMVCVGPDGDYSDCGDAATLTR